MHVVGTAGHVDHGKSSLVRALTGTDPDRWAEERERGMTLDLGFAHVRFPDGTEAGIVDVPGHERFLHNMLAGAAGMEVLLLVIAANEGPRPQTLEHLAILQYLNVKRTIVVLTKADLVDADGLAFAEELVREAVADTLAAHAPVLAVSTVTGAGLDALRNALHASLTSLPPRGHDAPPYLPVDRVFALPGHGTIVTGTLMQGRIAVGDVLRIAPPGRDVRVRGLQVFGERCEAVAGGARVAANLPGIETADIVRGAVLASPQFAASQRFAVRFRPLRHAVPMLKRRTPVRAYIGAAELVGTLVCEAAPEDAAERDAVLVLREPATAPPGAAFVVRRLSPKHLLGGGTVLATLVGSRASDAVRSSKAEAAHDVPGRDALAGSAGDEEAPDVAALIKAVRRAGFAGASAAKAGADANVREDRAEALLAGLVAQGRVLRLAKPAAYVDAEAARGLLDRVAGFLAAREAEAPWTSGTPSLGIARAHGVPEPTLVRLLGAFVESGALAFRAGYYATPGFVPDLTVEQRALFARILPRNDEAPLAPVAFEDVRAAVRASRAAGAAQAFDTLLASGELVKVGDAVYREDQIAAIRARLERALTNGRTLTAAQFRDLVGTSRKYAVPLLEWFDATGVTLRSGDVRVLRATRAASRDAAPSGENL